MYAGEHKGAPLQIWPKSIILQPLLRCMHEKGVRIAVLVSALFLLGALPLMDTVSAESEVDNWPENDAWLHIELIAWSANQSIEWDNNNGLPDPQFKICVEADGNNLDCINTPTWDNKWSLNNSWNYSIDIPDYSNLLNITIECEDNDAFNDDECDMNSELDEWKLFAEYNWSMNPIQTVSGNGNGDGNDTWKNAASTWKFSIDGFGDEDNDGVSDNLDMCGNTPLGVVTLDIKLGCSWGQMDNDLDGVANSLDSHPDDYSLDGQHFHGATSSSWGIYESEELEPYNHFYLDSRMHSEILINDRDRDGQPDLYPTTHFDINQNGYLDYAYTANDLFLVYLDGGYLDDDGNPQIQLEKSDYCNSSPQCIIKFLDLGRDGQIEMITDTGIHQFNGSGFSEFNLESQFHHCGGGYGFSPIHKFESKTGLDVLLCPHGGYGYRVFHLDGSVIEHTFSINSPCPAPCTGSSVSHWDQTGGIGDINDDGYIDLIRNEQSSDCEVYLGGPNGISNTSLLLPSNGNPQCKGPIEIVDMDLNGEMDIVSQTGIIFQNDELFESRGYTAVSAILPKVVDWDLDGDLDILYVERQNGRGTATSVWVFYNPSFIDSDYDGIADDLDLCPTTPSSSIVNELGCSEYELDDDLDSVSNAIDFCPGTAENSTIDDLGCASYQRDSDSDGITDDMDRCPNTAVGEAINFDGCSSFQSDSDDDGVMNSNDLCPNTPQGLPVDEFGCSDSDMTDSDEDSDGIVNTYDLCPNTLPTDSVDVNGCSDSQRDDDNDGIKNPFDLCSNTPTEEVVNSVGCSIESGNVNDEQDDVFPDDPNQNTDIKGDAEAASLADTLIGFTMCCIVPVGGIVYATNTRKKMHQGTYPNVELQHNVQAQQQSPQQIQAQHMMYQQQQVIQEIENQRLHAQQQVEQLHQQLHQSNQMSANQLSLVQAELQQMQDNVNASQQAKAQIEDELNQIKNQVSTQSMDGTLAAEAISQQGDAVSGTKIVNDAEAIAKASAAAAIEAYRQGQRDALE